MTSIARRFMTARSSGRAPRRGEPSTSFWNPVGVAVVMMMSGGGGAKRVLLQGIGIWVLHTGGGVMQPAAIQPRPIKPAPPAPVTPMADTTASASINSTSPLDTSLAFTPVMVPVDGSDSNPTTSRPPAMRPPDDSMRSTFGVCVWGGGLGVWGGCVDGVSGVAGLLPLHDPKGRPPPPNGSNPHQGPSPSPAARR